jgi:methyltransferase (TIGR00027 family)
LSAISRTAVYVAAGRALGAREPDPDVRNPDYLAERLLGKDLARFDLDLPVIRALDLGYADAMQELEVVSITRSMIVRTRFIDEALEHAVDSGASQLLILGAGLDSHAYRCQDLLSDVRVFEVDRPVTQAFKRQRVKDVLGGAPANLRYVPVDFETDGVRDVLSRHGYDFGQRSCVIMEGLTMHLSEAALRATLGLVASHPPGSNAVFDFASNIVITMLRNIDIEQVPPPARPFLEQLLYLIRDEPWEFGFPLGKEREYLDELGLEVKDLIAVSGKEAARRYLTKADGTELGEEIMRKAPVIPRTEEQAEQDAMAYRICEVVVPQRH